MAQDVRMTEVTRNAGSVRIPLEDTQQLHPGHHTAFLRWEQDSRAVFLTLFKPSPQRNEFVENRLSSVSIERLNT